MALSQQSVLSPHFLTHDSETIYPLGILVHGLPPWPLLPEPLLLLPVLPDPPAGAPQGLVLRPLILGLSAHSLGALIQSHG